MAKNFTTYSIPCNWCGEKYMIYADSQDINKWMEGTFIQDALPYLSPDDREMLISRTCPTCWTKTFGTEGE